MEPRNRECGATALGRRLSAEGGWPTLSPFRGAVAYVEVAAVGETLPDMPIFLKPEFYVLAPLEETYRITWEDFFPAPMKRLLEPSAGNPGET